MTPKQRPGLEGTIGTHGMRGPGLTGTGLMMWAGLCPSRWSGRSQRPQGLLAREAGLTGLGLYRRRTQPQGLSGPSQRPRGRGLLRGRG